MNPEISSKKPRPDDKSLHFILFRHAFRSWGDKLTGDSALGKGPENKSVWFAYADNGTLAIGTRSSLRKSLAALKGERPSLKPTAVKAAEEFKDWNLYLCFNNPRLIEAAAAQAGGNSASDRMAARIIRVMPHDQALIVTGARGDSEAMAVILSNEATQENIQYSVSASKTLTPKILKVYTESISELIKGVGSETDGVLSQSQEGIKALIVAPEGKADKWRGPYMATKGGQVPIDPWNQQYQYRYPGFNNPDSYDLFSKGRDKRAGTEDDIGNW